MLHNEVSPNSKKQPRGGFARSRPGDEVTYRSRRIGLLFGDGTVRGDALSVPETRFSASDATVAPPAIRKLGVLVNLVRGRTDSRSREGSVSGTPPLCAITLSEMLMVAAAPDVLTASPCLSI
jgi:hypothetical protein